MPPAAATECERTGWTLLMIATLAPACAAASAARWPARPAPMMRTSCSGIAFEVSVAGGERDGELRRALYNERAPDPAQARASRARGRGSTGTLPARGDACGAVGRGPPRLRARRTRRGRPGGGRFTGARAPGQLAAAAQPNTVILN